MKQFDNIIVIQSYPNALAVANSLSSFRGRNCIIVSLDYDLYRFFKLIAPNNFDVFLFGDARIVRHRIFKLFRKPLVNRIASKSKSFSTQNLILNYKHWCDIGALYPQFITFKTLEIWTAYEEERYTFEANKFDESCGYLGAINSLTAGMLKKYNVYESSGFCISRVIGLNLEHEKLKKNTETKVKQPTQVSAEIISKVSLPQKRYAVYVEREVLRSKHTTLFKYLKLMLGLKRAARNNGLDLYVKFKPRQYSFFKGVLHTIIGFRTFPNYIPAQIYCFDRNCVVIIGLTSSALALDYNKKFICLAKIKSVFGEKLKKNIESMESRTGNSGNVIYMDTIESISPVMNNLKL